MRILHWVEQFWPMVGGVEVFAARLVRGLHARGHPCLVAVAHRAGLPVEDEFHGIPVRRFDLLDALGRHDVAALLAIDRDVRRLADSFAPDVVHVHVVGGCVLPALRLSQARRLPLVVTLPAEIPATWRRSPETLFAQTIGSASWVAGVSSVVLEQALQLVPAARPRASVVPYGVDTIEEHALSPLPLTPPVLLSMARLAPEKGIDVLLRAAAQVAERFPAVQVVVAGDGSERPMLERLAGDLRLGERLRFAGWVPPDEAPAVLQAATIVVLPSRTEGLPLVALEAAAAARPVVASRVGGLPEAVLDGETGLLVPPDDPTALARALGRLLEHPDLAARMGRAGWERVRQELDRTRIIDRYEAGYARGAASDEHGAP